MKNLLMKFADQILSKDELKRVKGGDDPYGPSCGICYTPNGQRPCSGSALPGYCICPAPASSGCTGGGGY